jgi:hypothetical protein
VAGVIYEVHHKVKDIYYYYSNHETFIQMSKLWLAFTTILQKKHNYVTDQRVRKQSILNVDVLQT